ncbi:PHP domain-containing protein [bacterium]|nr:PHP domain-containing protein [bacterium]
MLRWWKADLHVHTVLSPCGDLLMGPQNIVERALEVGLDILAITDHNASENVAAVMEAAAGTGLTVLPGMEAATAEEAHFICLLPDLEKLNILQQIIYEHLPLMKNDPEFFGPQYIVNANNEILDENLRMLIFASDLKSAALVRIVTDLGGLVYPAHVDRKSYSLLYQLGFVPTDMVLSAMEISWNGSPEKIYQRFPEVRKYALITASDAHETAHLGRGITEFFIETPSLLEIQRALARQAGRNFRICSIGEL